MNSQSSTWTPPGVRHAARDIGSPSATGAGDAYFNPFVFKMAVVVEPGATVDRRLLLGVAVLAAAIEGRQQ